MSVSVEVIINGKAAKKFYQEGKTFIEGRKGSEYALRFTNNSSNRVEVVASIDGLSILDGKEASNSSQGYVLSPWQTTDITGWRLNQNEVAAFEFGKKSNSYAAATGKPLNVGVIGVKVFAEYVRPVRHTFVPERTYPWHYHTPGVFYLNNICKSTFSESGGWGGSSGMGVGGTATRGVSGGRGSSSGVTASASYDEPMMFGSVIEDSLSYNAQQLGTEFGEKKTMNTTNTSFTRLSTYPMQDIVIYYDSRRGLERRGIKVVTDHQDYKWANPFPGDGCQPPSGWKG